MNSLKVNSKSSILEFKRKHNNLVEGVDAGFSSKQDKLVSGQNIKTIDGQSLLGNGDITTGTKIYKHVLTLIQNEDSFTFLVFSNSNVRVQNANALNQLLINCISSFYIGDFDFIRTKLYGYNITNNTLYYEEYGNTSAKFIVPDSIDDNVSPIDLR